MKLAPLLPLLLLAAGCASAPKASIGARAPAAISPKGKIETYDLKGQNLKVEADVSAGSSYTIHFPDVTGTFSFSPDAPEASTVDVSIDTRQPQSSIQLVADIARDEFLHVATYPSAHFTSSALRKDPKGGGFTLFGTLDFHGTTKTLSTPAKMVVERCKLTVDVEFSIDRRAFGAVSTGNLDPLVSDNVVLRIEATVPRTQDPACAKSPA